MSSKDFGGVILSEAKNLKTPAVTLQVTAVAYKVTAVDTTAAGDTFTGYFMATIAAGKDVATALEIAAKAAAIAVSRAGAASSIPCMEEVITAVF